MTKRRTKRILAGVLAMTLAAAAPCTAYAGYWQYDGTGWWYERDDGSNPAGQWEQIDGIWYYFYGNGYMAADTQTPDGSYVDESGAWIPGYGTSRLTAQEVANILYSTNEPVGSYGTISMEIGQFSDDGTIYALFTAEDGELLWYGGYAGERGYGEDGITIRFELYGDESSVVEVTWYGREATDFPEVSGTGVYTSEILRGYAYESMLYGN